MFFSSFNLFLLCSAALNKFVNERPSANENGMMELKYALILANTKGALRSRFFSRENGLLVIGRHFLLSFRYLIGIGIFYF